jgi:hypothetical protein
VYPGKLPVRAGCVIVRNILAVEYFGFVLPLQEHLLTALDAQRSYLCRRCSLFGTVVGPMRSA